MRQYNMPMSETASQKPEEEDPENPAPEPVIYGTRTQTDQFIHYDFRYLCEDVKKSVPTPLWPNPDKEPLPPPETH